MPITKRSVSPVQVSLNRLPPNVKANELECVANGSLANLVRQLSSLSKHAENIFGEIFHDALKLEHKTDQLANRIDRLTVKVTQLESSSEEVTLQDLHLRKAFKSSTLVDQQSVNRHTLPGSLAELYATCDLPPDLDKLNPYREPDSKPGLKFYTDPDYFFELWRQEMLKDAEHAHSKKPHKPRVPGERKRHKQPRQPGDHRRKYVENALRTGEHIQYVPPEYQTTASLRAQGAQHHPSHRAGSTAGEFPNRMIGAPPGMVYRPDSLAVANDGAGPHPNANSVTGYYNNNDSAASSSGYDSNASGGNNHYHQQHGAVSGNVGHSSMGANNAAHSRGRGYPLEGGAAGLIIEGNYGSAVGGGVAGAYGSHPQYQHHHQQMAGSSSANAAQFPQQPLPASYLTHYGAAGYSLNNGGGPIDGNNYGISGGGVSMGGAGVSSPHSSSNNSGGGDSRDSPSRAQRPTQPPPAPPPPGTVLDYPPVDYNNDGSGHMRNGDINNFGNMSLRDHHHNNNGDGNNSMSRSMSPDLPPPPPPLQFDQIPTDFSLRHQTMIPPLAEQPVVASLDYFHQNSPSPPPPPPFSTGSTSITGVIVGGKGISPPRVTGAGGVPPPPPPPPGGIVVGGSGNAKNTTHAVIPNGRLPTSQNAPLSSSGVRAGQKLSHMGSSFGGNSHPGDPAGGKQHQSGVHSPGAGGMSGSKSGNLGSGGQMVDPRSDLLKAIRDGINLKKVAKREEAAKLEASAKGHDVAAILMQRFEVNKMSDSEESAEDFQDSDWSE